MDTRNGKIARLPRSVREALNRRLDDGIEGSKIVPWLNALPEVRAMVDSDYGGVPISEQNLSRWRQGGYRDWLARKETCEVAERLGKDVQAVGAGDGREPLTETLAQWLAAHYAVATRRVAETDGAEGWRMLREMNKDVGQLRRGNQCAQRLELDRERAAERDAAMKWGRKMSSALEALADFAGNHPEAGAAFDELTRLLHHPFDPDESQ